MSITRKIQRRNRRSETSLDLRVELQSGIKNRTPGSQVKRLKKYLVRKSAFARMLVGLLIRAVPRTLAQLEAAPLALGELEHRTAGRRVEVYGG